MVTLASQIRTTVHAATVLLYGAVILRAELMDYSRYQHEKIQHFGNYKYRFLTTWNFLLLSAHSLLALTCEYLLHKNSETKISYLNALLRLRDLVFTSTVLPVSFLVSTVFWGLYWVNRDLIFPEFLEPVLPPFDNHMVHTAIVPIVLAETLLQPRETPRSHNVHMLFTTMFFVLYGIPFFGTYFVHGEFLYPVVEVMSPLGFVFFCAVLWSYTLGLYHAQWPLVSRLWGPSSRTRVRAK